MSKITNHSLSSTENPRIKGLEDSSSHSQVTTNVPPRALSPISSNPMHTRGSPTTADTKLHNTDTYGTGVDLQNVNGAEESTEGSAFNNVAMPHSTSGMNGTSSTSHALPPTPPPPRIAVPMSTTVRNISAEFGGSRGFASNGNFAIAEDSTVQTDPPAWSSAVGKANLGKSGRVIERLMGEKDMLKRDLNLQRLQAEEAKSELKMAETRMEHMASDYETRLHDAAINKTLLKRRERQVEDLKAQIQGEKHRADTAVESEKSWKDQMEKAERDCKMKVDEANNRALLFEGRYTAVTSHWDDQGKEVQSSVAKLSQEISTIVDERRKDYERMNALQATCDQQNAQLDNLRKEKEDIVEAFRRYKLEQEQGLKDIKRRTQEGEKANAEALEETKKVLGQLKWALQVKKNVRDADTK